MRTWWRERHTHQVVWGMEAPQARSTCQKFLDGGGISSGGQACSGHPARAKHNKPRVHTGTNGIRVSTLTKAASVASSPGRLRWLMFWTKPKGVKGSLAMITPSYLQVPQQSGIQCVSVSKCCYSCCDGCLKRRKKKEEKQLQEEEEKGCVTVLTGCQGQQRQRP